MRKDRRKFRIRLQALIGLLVLSWLLIDGGIIGSYYNYLLVKNRAVVTATITGKSWLGHGQYNYRYTVDGREYTGTSQRDYSSDQYKTAEVGDQVPAYYSVDHPSVSSLYVPEVVVDALMLYVIAFVLWSFFLITAINPESTWALDLR